MQSDMTASPGLWSDHVGRSSSSEFDRQSTVPDASSRSSPCEIPTTKVNLSEPRYMYCISHGPRIDNKTRPCIRRRQSSLEKRALHWLTRPNQGLPVCENFMTVDFSKDVAIQSLSSRHCRTKIPPCSLQALPLHRTYI